MSTTKRSCAMRRRRRVPRSGECVETPTLGRKRSSAGGWVLRPGEYRDTLPVPDHHQLRCPVCPPGEPCELYADERLDARVRASDRAVKRELAEKLFSRIHGQHDMEDVRLHTLHATVHVRMSHREWCACPRTCGLVPVMEVVHVEVDPGHRRQLNFSRFLRFVKHWAGTRGHPLYVHGVRQAFLKKCLLKRGYVPATADSGADHCIDAYDWCLDKKHLVCFRSH